MSLTNKNTTCIVLFSASQHISTVFPPNDLSTNQSTLKFHFPEPCKHLNDIASFGTTSAHNFWRPKCCYVGLIRELFHHSLKFFFREKSMSLAILCDLFGMVKWPPNRDQKVTVWITWSLSWDEMKQPMMSWWFALLVYYPRKSSSKGNKNTWRCPSRLHQPTVRHWGSTLIVFCWIPVDFFSHDLTSFWGVVVQHGFVASSWSVAYQAYHIKFIESNSLKTSLFIRICDSADNLSFPNPCHFKRTWSRTKYKRGMT